MFSGEEESGPNPGSSPALVHPKEADFAHTAPRVTAQSGIDVARRISQENYQKLGVTNARRREVELIDLLLQKVKICGISFVRHDEICTHSWFFRFVEMIRLIRPVDG